MAKKKSTIYKKREASLVALTMLRDVLTQAKVESRKLERQTYQRKYAGGFQVYLAPSPDGSELRNYRVCMVRRFSLAKQIVDVINHVYVEYDVPHFLYRSMLSDEGLQHVFDRTLSRSETADWVETRVLWQSVFLAVAQGRSVYPLLKDRLTRRELHAFLKAPDWNLPLENVYWAKAHVAGLNNAGCQWIVDRLARRRVREAIGSRMDQVIHFIAKYFDAMRPGERFEITDFIVEAMEDPNFTLQGRTLKSVRERCRLWHRTLFSGYRGRYVSWLQRFPVWKSMSLDGEVIVVELTNSHMMAEEGTRQRHCIFTYISECVEGEARILSFRWIDNRPGKEGSIRKRVTAELWTKTSTLIQIRGLSNRMPTDEEMAIIREWCEVHGIAISPY